MSPNMKAPRRGNEPAGHPSLNSDGLAPNHSRGHRHIHARHRLAALNAATRRLLDRLAVAADEFKAAVRASQGWEAHR
ncbi:MAG: hypothetical protein E7Z95_01405 [Actinomyces succiniciruminis]|nr:hypothetical protein [Actinomyces succiniciruminis]